MDTTDGTCVILTHTAARGIFSMKRSKRVSMKQHILYFGLLLTALLIFSGAGMTHAQMMGRYNGSYGAMMGGWVYPAATSSELSASDTQAIAAGKAWYAKLQAKQVSCDDLTRSDFENLGEYGMDQMMGTRHAAMNAAMETMMGAQNEEAMHVAMGERFSGCDADAVFSGGSSRGNGDNYLGYMPMMGYFGYGPMMGYGYGSGWWGWIMMILFWALIVFGVFALVKWLRHGYEGYHHHAHSALNVLKERYARGEIDRKEFEEKRKDLES